MTHEDFLVLATFPSRPRLDLSDPRTLSDPQSFGPQNKCSIRSQEHSVRRLQGRQPAVEVGRHDRKKVGSHLHLLLPLLLLLPAARC